MEGKSIFDSSFNWQEIAIKHLKKTLKSQVYEKLKINEKEDNYDQIMDKLSNETIKFNKNDINMEELEKPMYGGFSNKMNKINQKIEEHIKSNKSEIVLSKEDIADTTVKSNEEALSFTQQDTLKKGEFVQKQREQIETPTQEIENKIKEIENRYAFDEDGYVFPITMKHFGNGVIQQSHIEQMSIDYEILTTQLKDKELVIEKYAPRQSIEVELSKSISITDEIAIVKRESKILPASKLAEELQRYMAHLMETCPDKSGKIDSCKSLTPVEEVDSKKDANHLNTINKFKYLAYSSTLSNTRLESEDEMSLQNLLNERIQKVKANVVANKLNSIKDGDEQFKSQDIKDYIYHPEKDKSLKNMAEENELKLVSKEILTLNDSPVLPIEIKTTTINWVNGPIPIKYADVATLKINNDLALNLYFKPKVSEIDLMESIRVAGLYNTLKIYQNRLRELTVGDLNQDLFDVAKIFKNSNSIDDFYKKNKDNKIVQELTGIFNFSDLVALEADKYKEFALKKANARTGCLGR